MQIIENETFTQVSAEELKLKKASFENCRFIGCDFFKSNLSNLTFTECNFERCNLALCQLDHTGLQDVTFKDCKLTGVNLAKTGDFLFEVHFEDCALDNVIFYKKKNKGGRFTNCSLTEADFTEADLTNAIFNNCNLNRAFFDRTQLKSADFTTSYNFIIDPAANAIKKAKFSFHGLPGLLAKYDIVIK